MTSLETHLESEGSQDMSQDSIFGSKEGRWTPKIRTALRQDPPIQLNHRDIGRRVHLRDASLLVAGVFLKAVACVIIGDAGIFPHEANDLTAATGFEIKVVDIGNAAYGFVAHGFGAAALGGRHLVCI